MNRYISMALLCFALLCGTQVVAKNKFYSIKVEDAGGKQIKLKAYKGKVLLIVNTATQCGFTPQYEQLESIYTKYRDQGFEILDFPCNQFGGQAPGTWQEIHSFCTGKYDIHFPQFAKIDVNGAAASPLFTYLKSVKGFAGFDLDTPLGKRLDARFRENDPDFDKNSDIKWNFTKFLVDAKGNVVARFEPTADMKKVEAAIAALLDKNR